MSKRMISTLKTTAIIPLLAILFVAGCSKDEAANTELKQMSPAETVGSTDAAPNFELTNIAGGTTTLADYEGKVIMLNFWATWCGPCKREIPDFIELQNAYNSKGFEIVGIALDEEADVRSFSKNAKINYDVLIGTDQTAMAYGNIRSIPTTFIINRDGQIVKSYVGLQPKEIWEQEIQALL